MTALTADRRDGESRGPIVEFEVQVEAGETLYLGSMVALDADGYATHAVTATGLTVFGVLVANERNQSVTVVNTGADGAIKAIVGTGVYKMKNSSSGDLIALSDIGEYCYCVDNQTVAKTSNGGLRSTAGMIVGVESDGVLVGLGPNFWDASSEDGDRMMVGPWAEATAASQTDNVVNLGGVPVSFVATRPGSIVGFSAVLSEAITGAGTAINCRVAINGTAVAATQLDFTQAGGEVEDRYLTAKGTTLHTFAAGDNISVVYTSTAISNTPTLVAFVEIEQ